MLRALCITARRQDALRYPCQVLHIVSSPPGETFAYQSVPDTHGLIFGEPLINTDQATSGVVHELGRQRPGLSSLHECSASPSRSAFPQPCVSDCEQRGKRECFPNCCHQQQVRWASSSSAASSKSKARVGSGKTAAATVAPRLRTPVWARMPLQLDSLPEAMRRRTTRLLTLHEQLKAEASKAEAGGWAAASKLATVEAAAQALPIPPKDSGEAQVAEATSPGTSFDAAYGTMKELCRRGICLSE
ncbi:hypothetical protein Vafri_3911 [Volvox africanus]|uniref:Uncharacterized protein n=1 Tax=Volvox africanus TaxID=51714 RepID=A0A8J4ATV8_9CHLO|nr:hypothetical protein Vafri_3911 [Volvox africanus]